MTEILVHFVVQLSTPLASLEPKMLAWLRRKHNLTISVSKERYSTEVRKYTTVHVPMAITRSHTGTSTHGSSSLQLQSTLTIISQLNTEQCVDTVTVSVGLLGDVRFRLTGIIHGGGHLPRPLVLRRLRVDLVARVEVLLEGTGQELGDEEDEEVDGEVDQVRHGEVPPEPYPGLVLHISQS